MGRRIAGTALCVALVALAGGCGKAWDLYQQAEIGQPLPADSSWPEAKQGGAGVYTWCESGGSTVPASCVAQYVSIETGENGAVIRKAYFARSMTNWLVGVGATMHHVVEFHLPSVAPGPEDETPTGLPQSLRDQIVRAAQLSGRDLGLGCTDRGPDFSAFGWNGEAAYGCLMVIGSSMHTMSELPLNGIETPGYDETFRNFISGSVRYQNLGGGRYRMEIVVVDFMDSLMLTFWPRAIPFWLAELPEQDCIRLFGADDD